MPSSDPVRIYVLTELVTCQNVYFPKHRNYGDVPHREGSHCLNPQPFYKAARTHDGWRTMSDASIATFKNGS